MSALELAIDVAFGTSDDNENYTAARKELAMYKSALTERDKWRAWKPDDEDLSALQAQAKAHDGTYMASLAACAAYIGALEARLRDRDAAIARADNLVNKIKKIHASNEYRAVWECAQVHRGAYRGESYEDELNALADAIVAIRALNEKAKQS